jgi:hypothetical protein
VIFSLVSGKEEAVASVFCSRSSEQVSQRRSHLFAKISNATGEVKKYAVISLEAPGRLIFKKLPLHDRARLMEYLISAPDKLKSLIMPRNTFKIFDDTQIKAPLKHRRGLHSFVFRKITCTESVSPRGLLLEAFVRGDFYPISFFSTLLGDLLEEGCIGGTSNGGDTVLAPRNCTAVHGFHKT